MKPKINPNLLEDMKSKASQAKLKFRISAFAFDKKGELLGYSKNTHRNDFPGGGKGKGMHAERILINRYGDLIKTIIICRVGRQGDILPIVPCKHCLKTADKLGIKIISVME